MTKHALLRGAVLALALHAAVQSAAHATDASDAAKRFGTRPMVESIDLSPDGRSVVYIASGPGSSSLAMVAPLDGSQAPVTAMVASGRPDRLHWCRFASDTQLVCQVGGIIRRADGLVPFSRLLTAATNGEGLKLLGQKDSRYDARLRQFDGSILDWLPGEDGKVLMARQYIPEAGKAGTRLVRSADGLGVDRIDLATLRAERVESPDRRADFFITDGRGQVRMKGFHETEGHGQLSGRWTHHYRLPGSSTWEPFSTWNTDGEGMWPLDVDATANSAYVLKKLDGRNALYRVALDGSLTAELVYANPRVDVDDVVRAGRGSGVIGVTYAEDTRHVVYFDPRYRDLAISLGKAIPELPMIDFAGTDASGTRFLVHAGSDADPGRYYLYDSKARNLNEILLARPALEHVPLASVRPISYPVRDGTPIPGYLTLPPGVDDARGLPGIVLPHGGPAARDEWGFDWLAQFLANRGYVVLQPNYRGSSGFGDDWMQENGFRSWRTAIGDITDGGRWLQAQGLVAADRLAIVGWSYGGYAALQSSAVDPGLFKAVVAIAPVTDLSVLKRDAADYTSRNLVRREIGSGVHLSEGSPLRNVADIDVPVLMFHGSDDLNVSVQHAQRMDAALRRAGKSSELVVHEGLEHSLVDSEARIQMLERIDGFLGKAVGR